MHAKFNEIRASAMDLSVGETTNAIHCPWCGRAQSFGVTRTGTGLLYQCLRVSCNQKGFIPSIPSALQRRRHNDNFVPRKYTKDLEPLNSDILTLLRDSYEISEELAEYQGFKHELGSERLYMPVFTAEGWEWGAVTKKLPWSDDRRPKSLTYYHTDTVKLHFPKTDITSGPLVLVEDILSATKISTIRRSAALLGTYINQGIVEYLARNFPSIIVSLDPDALQKAIGMKARYGLFFDKFKVVALKKDPKDTPITELYEAYK